MLYEVEAAPPAHRPHRSAPYAARPSSMSTLRLPAVRGCLPRSPPLLIAAPGASRRRRRCPPAPCAGRDYRPGEVVVRYARDAGPTARAAVQRGTGVGSPKVFAPHTRVLHIRDGRSVPEAIAALRRRPRRRERGAELDRPRELASRTTRARAGAPGGWPELQWNFVAAAGVDAPDAWDNLIAAGRPGGAA